MSDVGLGATLQLEITEALARIEQVGAQLNAAVTGIPVTLDPPDAAPVTAAIDEAVAASDTTITAEADAAGVTASIDEAVGAADTTVPVDADTAPAVESIAALDTGLPDVIVPVDADTTQADAAVADTVAAADAETATITVEADTTQADDAITATGDAASNATAGVDQLTGAIGGFNSSSLDAATIASGVTNALGSIGPEGKVAAAGITAVVGVIGSFVEAGTSLIAAEQRLTLTTGDLRDAVEQVHVGTLDTDLKSLAADTGSTIVPIDNAISRIFQLGKSSGESGTQIKTTSGEIVALAAYARSLNPSLGETGDIANRLTDALARGGRATQQYGLSIAAADILEKARQETGKQTVTQYEKTAAAADLLAQKLGPSFAAAINAGTQNPIIQIGQIKAEFVGLIEEIGKPLVAPVVEILKDFVPVGVVVGETLGALTSAVLPFIEVIGAVVEPVASAAAALVQFVAPLIRVAAVVASGSFLIKPLEAAFSDLASPVEAVGSAFSDVVGPIEAVGSTVAPVAEAVGVLLLVLNPVTLTLVAVGAAAEALVGPFDTAVGKVEDLVSTFETLGGGAIAVAIHTFDSVVGKIEDIGSAAAGLVSGPLGAIGGVFNAIVTDVDDLGEALNRFSGGAVGKVVSVLGAVVGFAEDAGKKIGAVAGAVTDFLGGGSSSEDKFTAAVKEAAKAADDQAVTAIKDAAAHGLLTAAQVDAALAAKDHTAALAALQPQIASNTIVTTAAAAAYKPYVDAANEGGAALAALTSSSPAAGAALQGLASAGVHPTTEALVEMAVGMNAANLSSDQLNNAAITLGVTSQQLTGFLSGVAGALGQFVSKVVSGLPSVADAFKPVTASAGSAGGAMKNTASTALQAQRSIESAQHGIEVANRGVADSADALVKANAGVQTSVENLEKAQENLQAAEQALADSRNPAKPKDVEQATINLERAQLNVTKATDGVAKAENDLNNARAGVGTLSVHDAEIALQDARLSAEESTIRVSDAEDALNTVRAVGTQQDPAVVSAEKAVATAHDSVAAAAQGVLDSAHQVVLAHRAVEDAAYAAKAAEEALQQALIKPAASGGGSSATKQAAVTLAEFVKNLEASTVKTQRFADDIKTIFDATAADGTHKFTELAGEIAQFGIGAITVADQAAAGIRTGNTALVESAEKDVKAQNKALADMEKFTKDVFGPQFIATTGLVANLATEAFGGNLDYADKMKIELQVTEGTLTTGAAAIAIIAGSGGADAATAYAKTFNIDDPTLQQGLAAYNTLHGTDLSTAGATAAGTANTGYDGTLTDPTTGLAATTRSALVAAGHAFTDPSGNGLGVLVAGSSSAAGSSLTAFVTGINPIGPAAGAAVASTGPEISRAAALVASLKATVAGSAVGEAFSTGVAIGMDPNTDRTSARALSIAAADLVVFVEKQTRAAANSHSPSLLFAEIGVDLTAGIGKGMTDPVALATITDGAKKAIQTADAATRAAIFDAAFPGGPSVRDFLSTPAVTATASTFGSRQNQGNGAAQIQVAVGPFTFDAGTTTEQAAALVRSATDSAVDAVRRRSAVFVAVQTAGQR